MCVQLELDNDSALVLFNLLASRDDLASAWNLEAPERNALWALEVALERTLSEPFSPQYAKLLEAARKTLVERGGK